MDSEDVKPDEQQQEQGQQGKQLGNSCGSEGDDCYEQMVAALGCSSEEFRSKKYYLFNAGAHELMIASLLGCSNPSAGEITGADPTFQPLPWQNKRGITVTLAIEERWRDFKAKLGVKIDAAGKRFLFHKRDASRYIPHTGQWLDIVKTCHVDGASRHWGRNLTKHQISKRWMYGERNHGIPESFVDAFIDICGCCRREQTAATAVPPPPPPPLVAQHSHSSSNTSNNYKKRKLGKKLSAPLFDVQFIKQKLDEIAQQVAASGFNPQAHLKHAQSLDDGACSDFESINEDEQIKLKEKLTSIRNEMDSMLAHLPCISRGKFLHFLEAMDGALSELRSPTVGKQAAGGTKLLSVDEAAATRASIQELAKPMKKVKWKDMARSPVHYHQQQQQQHQLQQQQQQLQEQEQQQHEENSSAA